MARTPSSPRDQLAAEPSSRTPGDLAYVEVVSSEKTRDINRDIVLEQVRSLQPISRVDLARASGLQPSTVSSLAEQLIAEGWIREGAVVKTARGRRPTMLSLNDRLVMLVADVRPTQAVVAVVDLNGRFLSRVVVPLGSGAAQGCAAIARAMAELREDLPNKTFEGAGICLPGRVDPETSRLRLAPNLKWHDFDIRGEMERLTGLRAELENAANACLLSELWFGRLDRVRNAVLVTISEGVGAAVLAEGRLLSGHGGMAGEFGHIVVDPAGPECGCGQRGCWEMFASSRAALRYFAELAPDRGGALTIGQLVAMAMDGERCALQALEMQATAIGRGVRMLRAALAPEVILFAGDVTNFWQLSHARIQAESRGGLPGAGEPRLLSIGDGEMARLRGAAAVVLKRHSRYYHAPNAARRLMPPGRPSSRGRAELDSMPPVREKQAAAATP